nr:unnamed protein product [Callosobruchus chinensis]
MVDDYVNYRGFSLHKNFLKNQEKLDNFSVRDEDVWVCGIPKSGKNMLSQCIG